MIELNKFKPFEPVQRDVSKVYTAEYNAERKAYKRRAKEVEKSLTIQPRSIYDDYIKELKVRIIALNEKKKDLLGSKNYLLQRIVVYKKFITEFTNYTFDDVIKTTLISSITKLKLKSGREDYQYRHFLTSWKAYIVINKQLSTLNKELDSCKRRNINYRVWHKLVKEFNEQVINQMITEGYEFKLGQNLASLRVQKRIRNTPIVDNPTSFQNRLRIIEKGGTPYQKDTAPDGEKWIVYRTERDFYSWYWVKKHCTVPNKSAYSWKPSGGVRGIIKLLYSFIEKFPNHVIKYTR